MPTHPRATGATGRAPEPPLQPCPPDAGGLLRDIGDVAGEHVLVVGRDGPDLMCALLRAGAIAVTHLASHERLPAEGASMVIVPLLPSAEWLARALPALRRALLPQGRIVLRTRDAADVLGANRLRRLLARHGYGRIDVTRRAGWLVARAEVPAFGLLKAA